MAEEVFKFKQFCVTQKASAMKIGFDSVLIGSWANVDLAESAIDAGTGTGVIALMLAQRKPGLHVLAVEIDEHSASEAELNARNSPWPERVTVVKADFRMLSIENPVDLIVSNPPFFEAFSGTKSPSPRRAGARQKLFLDFNELLSQSQCLLKNEGRLCLILPANEKQGFLKTAAKAGFYPCRCAAVASLPGRQAHRILLELGKSPCPCSEEKLVIEEKHHCYTREMIALTKDFYLNL
ncbi:MAG: methyltransferase [Spirochaetales bacterium]|nr:methyltransferase [Spirochaetales bacterium]